MSQPQESCEHFQTPNACDAACQCCCDACQERYEAGWARQVAEKNLCALCGIPNGELTLERLEEFKYVHFYQACDDCSPRVQEFFKQQNMCEVCRSPLTAAGDCPFCNSTTPLEGEVCGCKGCQYRAVNHSSR